jgi:anti-anti-sigma factor
MHQLQPQPFSIRVLPMQAQVVRVRVSGEVDLRTAPELERALVQEICAAREVLLDLSGISFIDSSGLRVIVIAARAAQSNGGALALDSRLPAQARRVLEITGLQSLIQVA